MTRGTRPALVLATSPPSPQSDPHNLAPLGRRLALPISLRSAVRDLRCSRLNLKVLALSQDLFSAITPLLNKVDPVLPSGS